MTAKADVQAEKEDRRLRLINRTMRLHGSEPHALIETLHTVQESFGYLDLEHLKYVASGLKVPFKQSLRRSDVLSLFHTQTPGKHTWRSL